MLEYSLFDKLPFRSQAEAIAKDGALVGQRMHNNWTVTLYTLNDRFVELWTGEHMQVFSTFKKSADVFDVIEPYLENMELSDLLD